MGQVTKKPKLRLRYIYIYIPNPTQPKPPTTDLWKAMHVEHLFPMSSIEGAGDVSTAGNGPKLDWQGEAW